VREIETGPVWHALTAGGEARVDRVLPVALAHTEARQVLATVRRDDVVEASGGVFAELESRWTPWLRSVAGVRYDQYRFDVSSSTPENSGVQTAGIASPKVSAILGPWARTELFANFGLGFHSNDARGTTMRVDPVDHVTPVEPVTPLVRTRGSEAGLRTEVVPGVQTSLALWQLDMDSELLFTGDAGTTEPSRPSHRQGLEWSARWQPLRWLLFDLDVAISKARFTAPDPAGPYIPGSIEQALSAGATIHRLGPWTAAIFLRYFGPRPLIEDDSIRSSASTLLNAQGSYDLSEHVRLELTVLNLLNARVDDISYWYTSRVLALNEPPQGVDGLHVHPAVPLTFRGTLVVSY